MDGWMDGWTYGKRSERPQKHPTRALSTARRFCPSAGCRVYVKGRRQGMREQPGGGSRLVSPEAGARRGNRVDSGAIDRSITVFFCLPTTEFTPYPRTRAPLSSFSGADGRFGRGWGYKYVDIRRDQYEAYTSETESDASAAVCAAGGGGGVPMSCMAIVI